ncbi:DUF1572 family protein [Polaribacter sp. Z022]|uniref:DinB family protein n=1 Tax=Polaribacter sp. Z022 TaxID=2927125 RepID=UPI002020BD93|nr:DUF1572 family protein [Polaribacter sp. Z022]MCL7753331.1 DUF1572 domain-containing protein [Polaribacter sp. Z022]
MSITEIITFYERDLNKVISEIELYKNEKQIWKVEKEVSNSAGNLVLHLIGNLHTFIGKELGKTNYVRNRELEFSQENISKKELINGIKETITMIKKSLNSLTDDEIKKDYPILKFEKKESTEFLLVHLAIHLSYHLGQINYHRRLLDDK